MRVRTEGEITRVVMRQGTLTRREFNARSQLAVNFYNRRTIPTAKVPPIRFDYEKASSPFPPKDHPSVIGSAKRFMLPTSVEIRVKAPAAERVERGNAASGAYIEAKEGKPFYIPIKPERQKSRGKSQYLSIRGKDVRLKYNKKTKKFYLVTKRVRSFSGYIRLRRSVQVAFSRKGARIRA